MLEKLDLTYFRQHEALTVTFEGLNCIRAPTRGARPPCWRPRLRPVRHPRPAQQVRGGGDAGAEALATQGRGARPTGTSLERSKGGATVYK